MIGDEILDNKGRTTPESSDMQALLAHMRDQGCSFVAAEGKSHALYLDRLNGTRFDYSIFTKPDPGPYRLSQDDGGLLSGEEEAVRNDAQGGHYQYQRRTWQTSVRRASERTAAGLFLRILAGSRFSDRGSRSVLQGTEFTIGRKDGDIRIFTPVIGDFMAVNATAAAAAALLEGIDAEAPRSAGGAV